jgi:DNA repair photolyase
MPLNKVKSGSNMYPFLNDYPTLNSNNGYTWNAVKGKCYHDCEYCYMKIFKQNPVRLDEKEFKTNLGKDNFIFVGSSTDMWAENIPDKWIAQVLGYCSTFNNKYLFQTKNPKRFNNFLKYIPNDSILACTIETNREYEISKAPSEFARYADMLQFDAHKMISIEPIMDFDLDELLKWINHINPDFVSIGADSKNHHLPEPNRAKIESLVKSLEQITKVFIKDNLKRLYD